MTAFRSAYIESALLAEYAMRVESRTYVYNIRSYMSELDSNIYGTIWLFYIVMEN